MVKIECDEARGLIDPGLDDELDAANLAAIETHIAGCPACAAERAQSAALREAIRGTATRYQAPDALRRQMTEALGRADATPLFPVSSPPVRRLRRQWSGIAAGFAAGAALAASVAVTIDQNTTHDAALDAVVTAHIRALQPGHLIDIPTSNQHVVKPWFDGKVDFVPPVKELDDKGFNLVGGRLDYVAGRNAAVLVYRSNLHMIDLFTTRTKAGGAESDAIAAPSGYNVVHWIQEGEEFWAVSDLNKDDLSAFATLWRSR